MVESTDIAAFLNATHEGPPVELDDIDDLGEAGPSHLAFCVYDDPSYVEATDAGAVVCLPSIPATNDRTLVKVEDPARGFWEAADEFFREWPEETQIHPSAVVADEAILGERCVVDPFVHVGPAVTMGDRCRIMPGTTIGDTGYAWTRDEELRHTRELHRGSVEIGDRVDVGSNCSIDRSIFDANPTRIGDGTKICNMVHVGHQVDIGENVEIMQQVNVSGNVEIGDAARLNPMAAIANDLTVGEGADVGMNATVLEDVPPMTRVVGTPAQVVREDVRWWEEW